MSKITFRADDELIQRLEEFDASKSEVMREALREFLENPVVPEAESGEEAPDLDDAVAERVDALVDEKLESALARSRAQDVNVNVTLEGEGVVTDSEAAVESSDVEPTTEQSSCDQCGAELSEQHVYCPNCGEKASHRAFCECGDEVRSDWSFCPSCGRRTPAADVLDNGGPT